jgi:hypothetical protein
MLKILRTHNTNLPSKEFYFLGYNAFNLKDGGKYVPPKCWMTQTI